MVLKNITVSAEYWSEEEIDEIVGIFSKRHSVEKRTSQRFSLVPLDPLLLVGISFVAGGIVTGIVNKIGSDIWDSFKNRVIKRVKENGRSNLQFHFNDGNHDVKMNLNSDDPAIIEKGFSTIDKALGAIQKDEKIVNYQYDTQNQSWVKISDRSFIKFITGIAATTDPITKEGKTVVIPEEELRKMSEKMLGTHLTLQHGGKPIGKITKAWVEDGKLKIEAGIFSGHSKEEIEQMEQIFKTGGLSLGFTHK